MTRYLVWIGRDDVVPASIERALEPWKPVLASRAEFVRNPKRRWFETAWPRDKEQMRAPKVIALYRTDRGRFAMDEAGDWQPSIKTTICTAKEDGMSVAYLTGLLNASCSTSATPSAARTRATSGATTSPSRWRASPIGTSPKLQADDRSDRMLFAPRTIWPPSCDNLLASRGNLVVLGAALEIVVRALANNRSGPPPARGHCPAAARNDQGSLVDPGAVARRSGAHRRAPERRHDLGANRSGTTRGDHRRGTARPPAARTRSAALPLQPGRDRDRHGTRGPAATARACDGEPARFARGGYRARRAAQGPSGVRGERWRTGPRRSIACWKRVASWWSAQNGSCVGSTRCRLNSKTRSSPAPLRALTAVVPLKTSSASDGRPWCPLPD